MIIISNLLLIIILNLVLVIFVVKSTQHRNKYCQLSCNYISESFPHTVCERDSQKCGPHENCGANFKIIKLNDNQRQYIVDLHNFFRNKVALGNETRGGKQPSASNMNAFSYNRELEFIAQCWANTCSGNPLNHDICRRTSQYEHVGQNLGFINSSIPNINIYKSLKELILLWYDEIAIFEKEWVNNTQDRGPNYKVGHYTQMLWAETEEIGCAASYYTTVSKPNGKSKWHHLILVCNYGPGGNYLGLPVYQIGKPASWCKNYLKPNKMYKGLCGKVKRVSEVKKFENFFN